MQTGLEEMKAAGVLCRSLQRAVRMESPSVLLGKGGVSGGVSCDFVELGMAPGWSCPPAVVLKAFQCHRAHFGELSRASFDQKSFRAFVFHRALLIFVHRRIQACFSYFSLFISSAVGLVAVWRH